MANKTIFEVNKDMKVERFGDGVVILPDSIKHSNVNTLILGTPGEGKAFRDERR